MTSLEDLPGPDWPADLTVPVDAIGIDGENPNEMEDEMFSQLVRNIRTNGWLDAILLTPADESADYEYVISDGEHRWKAAKNELDLDRVPALIAEDWDEADRRLARQTMNKIHGEHDETQDALEYDWLAEHGKRDDVLDLLDARDESFDDYMDLIRVSGPTRDLPPSAPPQGEVHNEDCVEGMRERLDDDAVDLVVTDPPYGVNVDISDSMGRVKDTQHLGTVANDHDEEEALELWDEVMSELDRVCAPHAHLYCFASWKTGDGFRRVMEDHGWDVQNCIVWIKKDANQIASFGTGAKPTYGYKHEFCYFAVRDDARPLNGYPDDVLEYTEARWSDVDDQETVHPTQKPVAMLEELIENSSERGDLVIDPFAGSGATGEAAVKLGRDTELWELEEEYIPTIERRVHTAKRQRDSPQNESEDPDADADEDDAEAGEVSADA